MTTDSKEKYGIEDYLKTSFSDKHESKPKRMIKTLLDDGTVVIGKNKYDLLKKVPLDVLTAHQQGQIKVFEDYHGITEQIQKIKESKNQSKNRLEALEERKRKAAMNVNRESIKNLFNYFYKKVNGTEFIETQDTLKNLEPLILYFAKDKKFLEYGVKDANGNFLSEPDLDKGLCIVGGFGNGKTSIMNTFHRMFVGLDDYSFGRFSSHDIILRYEDASKHNHPEILENLWQQLTRSTLYIDDVKAEPMAFAYGKKNMMNTLFLERYNKKKKTHISLNYAEGHNNDVKHALLELKSKYSNQLYDRVYEMCNIIQFTGKSFRI